MKKKNTKTEEIKKNAISSERPNLFEPNVYISMVVTLSGMITKEELAAAVEKAYAHNEATMSNIVLEKNGEAYYETRNTSGCKVFFDQRNWQEILKESEKKPFALKEGELVRTYITTGTQETILFLLAHHLVGDGKSILVLIQDIVDALEGKALEYKPMVLMDRNYLTQRAKLPLVVRWFVHKINRDWKRNEEVFTWEDYYSIHNRYWASHSSEIITKTYSAKEWKDTAVRSGVTLNSYLTAKLLQEYPESKVIGIPVSIREENHAMSNQTSGTAIRHQYAPERPLKENAEQIQKKLRKKIATPDRKFFVLLFLTQLIPTLIDSVLLYTHGCCKNIVSQKMADMMGYTGKNGRDLGITNLMKMEIAGEFERFRITDILFIPPKISYAKQVVGVATFEDKLNIIYHHMK